MPSVSVKLYSAYFKTKLKHKLQSHAKDPGQNIKNDHSQVSSYDGVPADASFVDGVATKDVNILETLTYTLSLRIFLPESALPQDQQFHGNTGLFHHLAKESVNNKEEATPPKPDSPFAKPDLRRFSFHCPTNGPAQKKNPNKAPELNRRSSWGYTGDLFKSRFSESKKDFLYEAVAEDGKQPLVDEFNELDLDNVSKSEDLQPKVDTSSAELNDATMSPGAAASYRGYLPDLNSDSHKKLPIIVQFHGGGFVFGSKDSAANDIFCRRMAKLCDAIVIAVGYRLAVDHKYPAAFDDGFEALSWLAKQANLAECSKSLGQVQPGSFLNRTMKQRSNHKELIDTFSGSMLVESWLAAHGDPSRCVLLGASSGANIADFVARKAVQAGRLLEPVKIVAQVLMYPFFIGSVPTQSEIRLANSYFFDRATCIQAWKLFFSEKQFTLDHPVANPLVAGREPPLKHMPPTLTVVGELDWMKDRAIAYSEALRKANLDAPVLEYKDAVHEFATLDFLVKSRQAEACAEDITIWIKKYISQKGHEFSY